MECREERGVRADRGSQQSQRAVERELRLLIQRDQPEALRLGALRLQCASAGRQREQQRGCYRARSARTLSRSAAAITCIDSLPAPAAFPSSSSAALNCPSRRRALAR